VKLDFSRQILQISNFIKFRPVGAEMFHADRLFAILKTRLKKTNKIVAYCYTSDSGTFRI